MIKVSLLLAANFQIMMKRVKLPSYIQWLLILGVIFLLLMAGLRITEMLVFPKPENSKASFFNIMWLGFRYDLRMVGIAWLLFFILSLIPPLNPFKTKTGKWVAFSLWTILIVIFDIFYITDFAHYAYLGSRLNASVLDYMADTSTSFGMMWETYPVIRVLIGLAISIWLLNWAVRATYKRVEKRKIALPKYARSLWGIAFFLLIALAVFGRAGQFPLRWSDAFTLGSDYASNMALNPFQSFFSTLQHAEKESYDMAKVRKYYPLMTAFLGVTDQDSAKLNYTRVIRSNAPVTDKPNVVIVLCESFSYLKSSMSGNKLNPTPYFDSLSKDGILFTRCFSPAVGTARGVWALLTGTPDTEVGPTTSRNPNAVNQHLIMNDFEGYDRYYFLGGSLSWANIRGVLENNIVGLKTFEQPDYDAPKINVWGVSDKHVFQKANEVFSQEKKPFVAVVQTADNHRPYTIPEDDKNNFKLVHYSKETLLANGFESNEELNAFRYTDFCYRYFIENARKEPYFKNTIFVFVGDHGTKGDASNYYPNAWTQGSLVFMHVPLLIYAPGIVKPEQINAYASQADVFPTVAGLAKINYTNTTIGRDLLSPEIRNNPSKDASFIYDPSLNTIGIIKDSVYYYYGMFGQLPEKVFSMTDNHPVRLTDSARLEYHDLTDAIFNTARYMVLHNRLKQ